MKLNTGLYSEEVWPLLLEQVLVPSWQLLEPAQAPIHPSILLPGALDEPVVQIKQRVFSNVCTHRGARLIPDPCDKPLLRCRYHGRIFNREGQLLSAPGFDCPPEEPLPELATTTLGPLCFTSLKPDSPFPQDLLNLVAFLPLSAATLLPEQTHDYLVEAHFLLYLENYLEGLHIPFVHPSLNAALDWKQYSIQCFPGGSVQIGLAASGTPAFSLPASHPNYGQRIAAFWVALHPTTLLNFYPWGLSVNRILPEGPRKTRIRYHSWAWDTPTGLDSLQLSAIEQEDDAIVEEVQQGIKSRLYQGGSLAPKLEIAIHHLQTELITRLKAAL
jgi:choline monooxygenase